MLNLLPISALVPTRNRPDPLARTLESLAQQSVQPVEMVVIDASSTDETRHLCQESIPDLFTKIIYRRATEVGAATQRNQAIHYASQSTIWFMDDDILFEPGCLEKLWVALQGDPQLGGVNAMITNQLYLPPGRFSRLLFQFLNGYAESSYAGQCIGPGLNLLPEDHPDLAEVVPVEWLNTTCVLYRREALSNPPFPNHFTGYSLMEDVTLSLTVGKRWKLANARTARIFHDSQPGEHKNSAVALAKMELVNRYYVMSQVLQRNKLEDYLKLGVLQLFWVAALLTSIKGWLALPGTLVGKLAAIGEIISTKHAAKVKRA